MTTETAHYFTSNETLFKCDFCALTYRTSSERNVHILDHLQKKSCSICQQSLIQLGDIWYSPHEHPNHTVIKSEFDSDAANHDILFERVVDCFETSNVKIEADPIGNYEGKAIVDEDEMDFAIENEVSTEMFEQKPIHIVDVGHEIENSSDAIIKTKEIQLQQSTSKIVKLKCNNSTQEIKQTILKIQGKKSRSYVQNGSEKGCIGICGICDQKFASRSGLKSHMNKHLNLKPFKWEICGEGWTSQSSLIRHTKNKRKCTRPENQSANTSEKETENTINENKSNAVIEEKYESPDNETECSLTCDICNKTFLGKGSLEDHIKSHIDPKKYECETCGELFALRKTLRNHARVHLIVRFHCNICDKSYTDKRCLERHLKWHAHENELPDLTSSGVLNLQNCEDSKVPRETTSTYWLCEYCNTHFEFDFNLTKHISKEHSDDNQEHQCNICAGKFNQLDDLLAHMRAHPESTQYKCTFDGCDQGFAYKADFATHLSKHNRVNGPITRKTQDDLIEIDATSSADGLSGKSSLDKNDFVCHICSKQLANKISLQLHIERTHTKVNDRIKCTVAGCDKIFKSILGLTNHIKVHHPDAINKCDVCQRNFYSETLLAKHKLKHIGSFQCSFCSKIFRYKHRLRAHIAQHEKDAICNICDNKFVSAKAMMKHREGHGKKQILTCRFKDCNQVFEDRREFFLHASQHPESGKKKRICPHCGKAVGKSYLRDHINTHTGERPHECVHCKKTFAIKGCLKQHLLIHSGEKPYACDIEGCDRTYRDSVDLKRHKFSVHKIYTKKHICSICLQVFPERKLLTKHTMKEHNILGSMQ